ncbi:MAG TPA: beta-ketoacyl synthase chain length factor [Steroidobacteraceae bacterium]|nr:beta-ketoacyl synthase chain length factor [Steroidobacteraceae bacterium]
MSAELEVAVAGFAAWNPRAAERPQPTILPPNERRRAPDTVAIALQVAQAACANANREPAQLPMVFASTYGDLAITDYMCSTLASAPTTLSPTRFHNSVHNAAAGYWSIATGCRQPYCALGAGAYTFANGLFTAALQACADGTDVLYVAYDSEARGVQTRIAHSHGMLGLALVLTRAGGPCTLRLGILEQQATPQTAGDDANAMADCLPLLVALERRADDRLRLPLGPDSVLQVQVRPDSGRGLRKD